MARKKVLTQAMNIKLSPEEKGLLTDAARQVGVSASTVLRMLISAYLCPGVRARAIGEAITARGEAMERELDETLDRVLPGNAQREDDGK